MTGSDCFSYSAYINFEKKTDAALAVLALECAKIGNFTIKASFGTTKYCNNYIAGFPCKNKDCLYLHKQGEDTLTVDKDDMAIDKKLFSDQLQRALKISEIANPAIRAALLSRSYDKAVFPSLAVILSKDTVLAYIAAKTETDVSKTSFNKLSELLVLKSDEEKEVNENGSDVSLTNETHRSLSTSVFSPKTKTRFVFEKVTEDEAVEVPNTVSQLLSNYSKKYVFFIKNRENMEREEINKTISGFKTDEWLQDVKSILNKLA